MSKICKKRFYLTIKRNTSRKFLETKKRIEIKKGNVKKTVEVNRHILGKLVVVSAKYNKSINYKKVLKFPLSPIPLSISNADGSMRKMNKSAVAGIILNNATIDISPKDATNSTSVCIVDMISVIGTLKAIPETFGDLATMLIKILPTGNTNPYCS